MMRSILALAGVAAAGAMAFSTANAQECVNGYRTLGNDVVTLCDEPMGFDGTMTSDGALPPEQAAMIPEGGFIDEPMTTGSIAAPPPAAAVPPDYREQQAATLPQGGYVEEPAVTGSLASAPAGGLPLDYREGAIAAESGFAAPTVAMEAEGPWACQPGQYWVVGGEGRDTPVFCR